MSSLEEKKCIPCEGGIEAYTKEQVQSLLPQIPEWQPNQEYNTITREFTFKGFLKTMSFVNAIAWIAQQEMHHPDMEVGYNYCRVHYTTHAINGLSENDFICAAKINQLIITTQGA